MICVVLIVDDKLWIAGNLSLLARSVTVSR